MLVSDLKYDKREPLKKIVRKGKGVKEESKTAEEYIHEVKANTRKRRIDRH